MFKIKQQWAGNTYLLVYNKERTMKKKTTKKKVVRKSRPMTFMDKVIKGTYNFFASPWSK
tara:strand:+ start:37 stop:216 length:180 start_codon:yes stop_codon:yes gene_type:complete